MRLALSVVLVVLVGCAGSTVRTQTTATDGLIATARDNGAQKCAPVELAMAESHNDYAEHALDEGNYYDAKREAEVAATNAQSAIDKSPKERCVGYGDKDGDGIKDNVDKCPNDPEDKDGFQDEDGCPDPDNDGDGLFDKVDQCPNDAEDKDGFQDEDGCPDPDNDGDGVLDAADKCPNQPETKNGYQDDDGCPDEIPAKIKQFTGVIQGINFKVSSAETGCGRPRGGPSRCPRDTSRRCPRRARRPYPCR